LADGFHFYAIIKMLADIIQGDSGDNTLRVRVLFYITQAAQHAILFAIVGQEDQGVWSRRFGGEELRQM
jgi:hypothetical protein